MVKINRNHEDEINSIDDIGEVGNGFHLAASVNIQLVKSWTVSANL